MGFNSGFKGLMHLLFSVIVLPCGVYF